MGSDDVRRLSPAEFAKLCVAVQDCREASWVDDNLGRYTKSYRQAAKECCPQPWAEIVAVLLFPGYGDVWEWVNKVSEE